ncbi:MAG: dihydroneopterin aldolase [Verrucomicrobia bacterium]|nr:dihydroneopterin aldolase [Verrucomicrobiota bacterium]
MDKMFIVDLKLKCIIGTKPEERRRKQEVVISICLETDLRKACKTDKLEDTVNYHSLEKKLIALVEMSEFLLLEKLAESIAALSLYHDRRIQVVHVRLAKPAAGIKARGISIEIRRARKSR